MKGVQLSILIRKNVICNMNLRVNLLLISLFGCIIIFGCGTKTAGTIKVNIVAENTYNQVLYLDNIPSENEQVKHLDSVAIKERVENVFFKLPQAEEELFRIYTKDHRVDIVLINDEPLIELYLNYLDNGNFQYKKSSANISLHRFLSNVREKAIAIRALENSPGYSHSIADSLYLNIQFDYRNFVDSVASPAAALYIYNNIDFGSDRLALRKFISKLGNRFRANNRIQDLYKRTIAYLAIFEEELEVGMPVPELILPSKSGEIVSLSSFKGKYLLVDFWASWDTESIKQENMNVLALKKLANKNFSIVSISLDPEREVWKQYLSKSNYDWTQLIDQNVWMGPSVKAFKFDSIPFNFLVDPSGKIVGKAMYGDSLLLKLEQVIK